MLVAFTIALATTSCANLNTIAKRDPALNVGKLKVTMKVRRLERLLGPGTPAAWTDHRGQRVHVLLYRNARNVLAAVVDDYRVLGFEFYEYMTDAQVHSEFTLPQAIEPATTRLVISQMPWLERPIFSDTLPTPPPGWTVPTDFTSAARDKSFYVTHDEHVVSKERDRDRGWSVHIR